MDRRIWPLHQPREKIEIELLVLGDHINQSRNRGLANDKERLGQRIKSQHRNILRTQK